MTHPTQEQLRDIELDRLATTRAHLVSSARQIAWKIATLEGRVTSPEVIAAMRTAGYGPQMDRVDPRFMGVVFRAGNRWERLGWENKGSHARPVAIWGLR